ncbi:hypothetical protein BGZ46_008153, partial [Entomortierella lignicola]
MASNSASTRHPLDIPEIRIIVGHFLQDNSLDLLSCALVSRAWSADFIPMIWVSIRFGYHLSQLISQHAFRKHEHLIRSLFIHDPSFFWRGFPSPACKNLIRLEYVPHIAVPLQIQSAGASHYDSEDFSRMENVNLIITEQLNTLIEQQDSIAYLQVDCIEDTKFPREFRMLQSTSLSSMTHPKLTTLHLSKWLGTTGKLNMLIKGCPGLKHLSLRSCEINRFPSNFGVIPPHHQNTDNTLFRDDSTLLDFGNIRTLKIDLLRINEEPIKFVGNQVESIEIESYTAFIDPRLKNHSLRYNRRFNWRFPSVRRLSFLGKGGDLYETEVGGLINSILCRSSSQDTQPNDPTTGHRQVFFEISLNNCQVPVSMINNINQQLGDMIDIIDLGSSTGFESRDIQQILILCGNLRVFRGPETFFWARDMTTLTGQYWATNKLEEFVVLMGFSMNPINQGGGLSTEEDYWEDPQSLSAIINQEWTRRSIELICQELSRQQSLEILDLSGDINFDLIDDNRKGIPLVLEAGLDRLKGLKNMRRVIVTGWEEYMGEAEAEWMKIHWPKLEYIHSREGGSSDG